MTDDQFPMSSGKPLKKNGRTVIWYDSKAVPDPESFIGDDVEFDCPYPSCLERHTMSGFECFDDIEDILEANDGTLRCPECNEPLYGIFGDGDQR